ncbi:MAG: leucyl aminopeptidase, partial [Dehalococcoidales bacterium]|nr:leucyl aminopeptidase [Dehalococcoidales bacterium]
MDKTLGGEITALIKHGEIKGKLSEVTVLHSLGKVPAARVVIVGLGKAGELTQDKIRIVLADACCVLSKKGVKYIASTLIGIGADKITPQASAQAITEGAILGLYTFRRHMTKKSDHSEIEQLTIIVPKAGSKAAIQRGADEGKILAEAANLARDMVNEPSNYMTPTDMAKEAKKIAGKYGLGLEILERKQMKELGMGALLGVAQGSQQPPKFIVLKYQGNNTRTIDIALVGKGITFDSGGISLKPSDDMGDMKGDMAGGASVMAAMSAIAQFNPKVNVIAIVAATENLPSGTALKPADVLTAMNGKTIEIVSTDAEGRLTLADALGYANKQGAKRIIDIATLTGSCVKALGDVATGAFTNNQEFIDKVIAAGAEVGDKMWQMPMFEEYKEQNKSDVADLKNTGGAKAGLITAALFVGEFAGNTPWVHLDIAGTSLLDKPKGYYGKGATGVPIRTLVKLVLALDKKGGEKG